MVRPQPLPHSLLQLRKPPTLMVSEEMSLLLSRRGGALETIAIGAGVPAIYVISVWSRQVNLDLKNKPNSHAQLTLHSPGEGVRPSIQMFIDKLIAVVQD